jgi:hypothetical protein
VDLVNRTRMAADIIRGSVPNAPQTVAALVAKATGVVDRNGQMRLDFDTPTPVLFEPLSLPFGEVPSDVALQKEGVDVVALGKAYHPDQAGGPRSAVTLQVNRETRGLAIFGNRLWYKAFDGTWRISDPEPFSLMDMGWQQSFGGVSLDEECEEVVHPLNPQGCGFIASESAIDGTNLPNVEDVDQLIRTWRDQPRPCNICPAPKHLSFDVEKYADQLNKAPEETFNVPPSLWNIALPKFRFPALKTGDTVMLRGMSEKPLGFVVPAAQPRVVLTVGDRQALHPLRLDTVVMVPQARRCIFSWRVTFTYEVRPREARVATLTDAS